MDYKKFDSTIPAAIFERLWKIYDRIYEYNDPDYSPKHREIRRGLRLCLVRPLLHVDNVIVQAPGGNVSGQPLTSDDNGLVNMIYAYYAWRQIYKDQPRMKSYDIFLQNVEQIVYGDDCCISVSPSVQDSFTFERYAHEMRNIGVTVTNVSKIDGHYDMVPVEEFEFLKRTFKKDGNFVLGLLDKDSIGKALNFTTGQNHMFDRDGYAVSGQKDILEQTAQNILQEVALYDEPLFNRVRQHIQSKLAGLGSYLPVPSYKDYRRRVYYGTGT
jgi:hypothetical protein